MNLSRNRGLPRAALSVAALCLLPGLARGIEFERGEHAFELTGFLSSGNSVRLTDPDPLAIGFNTYDRPGLVTQANKLRLSLYGTHPRDISSLVTVDFLYTSDPGRPFDSRGEVQLDEAYVDFLYRDWDVRLGLQKVIWGKSDLISPFDILTARDFKDPFVYPTIEDRIGQAGVRLNRTFGEATVEVVLFPVWLRSRVPEAETDDRGDTRVDEWFPPMAIYPADGTLIDDPQSPFAWMIFIPTYNEMETPARDPSTASFGVKVNRLFGEFDVDFYLVSALDPTPTANVRTIFAQGTIPEAGLNDVGLLIAVDGNMLFKRVTTIGAAGARTIGPVALRSEMAIAAGRQYFRLFDPAGADEALLEMQQFGLGEARGEPKSHAEWIWINGADYEFPGPHLFTSSQLAITKRFGHEDFYTQSALDVDWTFLLRRTFLDDYLSVTLTGMAGLTSGSVWISPSIGYTPPAFEDVEFGARLNIFAGDDFSKIGMYGDQSNLALNLRLLF